ncbi:MAG TPA: flavin prenyltransferase UbiX [Gammaproteobacteria bacterium]|nr:flavin prenyltransferase UbiX [Gammaproteobacteria bacterium]
MTKKTIALAMTGASGALYGLRLLECLLSSGQKVYLMLSKPAQVVIGMETDLALPGRPHEIRKFFTERFKSDPEQLQVFDREQWTAPVASGSGAPDAMVICPCTTGTLAAVAAGACDQLMHRAADVMLKERRPLILVLRETPYSAVHLRNMLAVTDAGAVIMPSNPGFYNKPQRIEDLIDFMVARILDHLRIDHRLLPRWGSVPED